MKPYDIIKAIVDQANHPFEVPFTPEQLADWARKQLAEMEAQKAKVIPGTNLIGQPFSYLYGREVHPNEKVVDLNDALAVATERDRLREELRRLRGEHLPQRQDSLMDQLTDLIPLATQAGCYDAADFLRNFIEDKKKA